MVRSLGMALNAGGLPLCLWPVRKETSILESSARGPMAMMLREKFDYYATEFDPARIAAGTDPREYADFQNLHYKDDTFDVVIASDVFEHVRDDVAGYREVYRVLKMDGCFLLTVPYEHSREETIRRVDTTGAVDVHLLEPEYHGGGGHTLTYRNYGRDLLRLLRECGFAVGCTVIELAGLGITQQRVFLGRKGDFVEYFDQPSLPERSASTGPLFPFRAFLFYKYNFLSFLHYMREIRRR